MVVSRLEGLTGGAGEHGKGMVLWVNREKDKYWNKEWKSTELTGENNHA